MNVKINKLLFELTRNIRITTKELGKRIKTTQQSSSYQIKQLNKKRTIQGSAIIIDNVKLGLTNVLIGLNYLNFEPEIKREILDELKSTESIVSIEEAKQGVDLIIEYTSANLSAFNRAHTELIQKFNKSLKTKFVFPIIVRHKYFKNYLIKKMDNKDMILYGDRNVLNLQDSSKKVLNVLVKDPDAKIIEISKITKISVKSVVKIKKNLQKKEIIKGYSCILNNQKLGIDRYFLFLKFSSGRIKDMDKLVTYSKQNKNIIELIKLIGEFHVVLTIEELKETNIIKRLRSSFPIENYLVVKSENIIKRSYLPLNM